MSSGQYEYQYDIQYNQYTFILRKSSASGASAKAAWQKMSVVEIREA